MKHQEHLAISYLQTKIRHLGLKQLNHYSELLNTFCPLVNNTLLNVVVDQSIGGLRWTVKTADKLIKAHCLPLDCSTLKSSSP